MKPDHIITCVYCGQTYPENTPTHGADVAVLTQHISQCEKHPMRAVIRERDDCLALLGARKMELDGYVAKLAQNVKEICELKAQLAQLRQEYDRYTEQQTDLTQREHQRHVEIKERLEQQLAQAQTVNDKQTQLNNELEAKLAQVRQEYSRAHESWLDEAKRLEAEAACLRDAFDKLVSKKERGHDPDWVVDLYEQAIATAAGRDLLERLAEAAELLSCVCGQSDGWSSRRDKFLAREALKGDKGP